MRFCFGIMLLFLLSACVNDNLYKNVEPYYIFHANSSKVWVQNHIYENGTDRSPLSLNYKKMLVFHNSRNCYEYSINNLGLKKGKKGYFSLNSEENKLEIQFGKEVWTFRISYITDSKIILSPYKDSKNKYKIELISFPEY